MTLRIQPFFHRWAILIGIGGIFFVAVFVVWAQEGFLSSFQTLQENYKKKLAAFNMSATFAEKLANEAAVVDAANDIIAAVNGYTQTGISTDAEHSPQIINDIKKSIQDAEKNAAEAQIIATGQYISELKGTLSDVDLLASTVGGDEMKKFLAADSQLIEARKEYVELDQLIRQDGRLAEASAHRLNELRKTLIRTHDQLLLDDENKIATPLGKIFLDIRKPQDKWGDSKIPLTEVDLQKLREQFKSDTITQRAGGDSSGSPATQSR